MQYTQESGFGAPPEETEAEPELQIERTKSRTVRPAHGMVLLEQLPEPKRLIELATTPGFDDISAKRWVIVASGSRWYPGAGGTEIPFEFEVGDEVILATGTPPQYVSPSDDGNKRILVKQPSVIGANDDD